jgi:glyoxylase-like metal-dependent hydrolase (beta-lactamase superfamily II)
LSAILSPGGFEPVADSCRRAVVPSPWPPRSVAVFLLDSGGPFLVDTGAATVESVEFLAASLDETLGPGEMPEGVILTHSHLDHAGGLEALAPDAVIAHQDAAKLYEADDRTPGGQTFVTVTGTSGALPDMPGWEWVLGKGHAPGHLLLWQPETGTFLAGDQFLLGLKTPLRIADPEEGSFGDYLETLDRVAALQPAIMLTGHTEAIRAPSAWLDRERRRLSRQLDRTRTAVRSGARDAGEVTERTYGSIPGPGARQLLLREKLAALRHLALQGEIQRHLVDGQETFEG